MTRPVDIFIKHKRTLDFEPDLADFHDLEDDEIERRLLRYGHELSRPSRLKLIPTFVSVME